MTSTVSPYKRRRLFLLILMIAFSAFTADVVDLREDLHILSSQYSSLESSIVTCIPGNVDFDPTPVIQRVAVGGRASVKISFLHLLPHGFRAPPAWS